MTNNPNPERSEIEDLLPWHAAGTLSPREAQEVDAALTRDPELMRRYMLTCEEMAATVDLNETLGQPSPQAITRLFAAIDAEGERRPARAGLVAWFGGFMASLTPRQLAFSAAAAAVAILLQAGLIGSMLLGQSAGNGSSSQTAASSGNGNSYAFVRFAPEASASDISALLEANKVAIVDGPRPGGVYRVRMAALPQDNSVYRSIEDQPSAQQARDQTIAKLRAASNIVRFVVAAPPGQ